VVVTDQTQWVIGLDPTTKAPEPTDERTVAARPGSLDGAVVGLISNGKGKATVFLHALYDELSTMADLDGKVFVEKESVYAIPSPDDWARVTAGATVGITGFGG
jgi:hypothetical protein